MPKTESWRTMFFITFAEKNHEQPNEKNTDC